MLGVIKCRPSPFLGARRRCRSRLSSKVSQPITTTVTRAYHSSSNEVPRSKLRGIRRKRTTRRPPPSRERRTPLSRLQFVESLTEAPWPRLHIEGYSFGPRDAQEPVRHCLRDEAKEVRPDARPQARKNRRRIRRNTLRIFQGRERHRWLRIIRRSRTFSVGQAPRHRNTGHTRTDAAATAWDRLPCGVCSRSRPRSGPY